MKTCTKCLKQKDLSKFYVNKSYKDGYTAWCRSCKAAHIKATNNLPLQKGNKKCSSCKEIKSITDFYVDRHILDGYSCRCKLCKFDVGRNSRLKQKYSLDQDAYLELLKKQNNGCGICGFRKSTSR
jgi:hypothetical protein